MNAVRLLGAAVYRCRGRCPPSEGGGSAPLAEGGVPAGGGGVSLSGGGASAWGGGRWVRHASPGTAVHCTGFGLDAN